MATKSVKPVKKSAAAKKSEPAKKSGSTKKAVTKKNDVKKKATEKAPAEKSQKQNLAKAKPAVKAKPEAKKTAAAPKKSAASKVVKDAAKKKNDKVKADKKEKQKAIKTKEKDIMAKKTTEKKSKDKAEVKEPKTKKSKVQPEKEFDKKAATDTGFEPEAVNTNSDNSELRTAEEVVVTSPKKTVKKIKGYSKEDLEYFKNIILEKREEIIEQLQNLREQMMDTTTGEYINESSPYSLHMAEQGTDAMEREKLYLWAQRENKFLGYLDDALQRIENGTYGICVDCIDEPQNLCPTCPLIPKDRLAAVPHSQLCLPVKQKQEKK